MNSLTTTLFLIAALCLLPSVIVGLVALGAGVGIYVYELLSRQEKAAYKEAAPRYPESENIVYLKDRR